MNFLENCFSTILQSADLFILKYLIETLGLPIDKKMSSGSSPLCIAAWQGQLDATKYLVDHGANINLRGSSGETPIAIARRRGHEDVVRYLSLQ